MARLNEAAPAAPAVASAAATVNATTATTYGVQPTTENVDACKSLQLYADSFRKRLKDAHKKRNTQNQASN